MIILCWLSFVAMIICIVFSVASIIVIKKNKRTFNEIMYYLDSVIKDLSLGGDTCAEKATEFFAIDDNIELKTTSYSTVINNLEIYRRSVDSLIYLLEKIKSEVS